MQLTKRINQLRAASEINIFSCKMWRREAIVIACLLVLLLSNSALVIVDAAPSLSTSGDRNCSAVLAAVEGLGVPKSLGKGEFFIHDKIFSGVSWFMEFGLCDIRLEVNNKIL